MRNLNNFIEFLKMELKWLKNQIQEPSDSVWSIGSTFAPVLCRGRENKPALGGLSKPEEARALGKGVRADVVRGWAWRISWLQSSIMAPSVYMTFWWVSFDVVFSIWEGDLLMLPLRLCSHHQLMGATHNPIFIPIPGPHPTPRPTPHPWILSLLWFSSHIWPSFSLESSLTPKTSFLPVPSSTPELHPNCGLKVYS